MYLHKASPDSDIQQLRIHMAVGNVQNSTGTLWEFHNMGGNVGDGMCLTFRIPEQYG